MDSLASLSGGPSRPGFSISMRSHSSRIMSTHRGQRLFLHAKPVGLSFPGHKSRKIHYAHAQSPSLEQPSSTDGKSEKLMWFEKKKELWEEVTSGASLKIFLKANETGKPVVFDFYAGWCSSCKTAYPALCKIAGDHSFREKFVFAKANIQMPGILGFIRSLGIKGIPTIAVFDKDGDVLTSFGASFRKMNVVKANLVVISANTGSKFLTDPNGFVIPKPE